MSKYLFLLVCLLSFVCLSSRLFTSLFVGLAGQSASKSVSQFVPSDPLRSYRAVDEIIFSALFSYWS